MTRSSRSVSGIRVFYTLCFLIVIASAQAQRSSPPPESSPTRQKAGGVETEDLGPLPKDKTKLCVSADGLHIAAVMPSGTKQRVFYDGQAGAEFDEIAHWTNGIAPAIRIAPNGAHLAYIARRGRTNFLCLDDQEIEAELPALDEKGQQLFSFTPDSEHLVYVRTADDGLWHVVFDNEVEAGFTQITPPILFSAQGGHYAYIGESEKGEVVVIDGKPGMPVPDVGKLQFSPDGRHYAYRHAVGDKFVVTLDGKPGHPYDDIQLDSIQFSANGKLAYAAHKETGDVAIVDGKETGATQQMGQLTLSSDGKRVAYVSTTSDGQQVIVDGKLGRAYEKISSLMFSPDGSRVAYDGHLSTGDFVVLDEEESPAYHTVGRFQFSANGKCFGYTGETEKGQVVVVINGQASKPYRTFIDLAISPDGSHYAYEGDPGIYEAEYVIDGKAVRARDIVATLEPNNGTTEKKVFCFSSDSKHLAMASMVRGGGRYLVTVDGNECPTSGWFYRFTFSHDGSHFAYVTREPTRGIWDTVAIVVDCTTVQALHLTPEGDLALIAQIVEDRNTVGIKRVNPNYFQFRDDGKLKYLAVKDGRIARVSVSPGAVPAATQAK